MYMLQSSSAFWDNNYVVELVGGLITPLIIIGILFFFRPRIKISPHICKLTDPTTGNSRYLIKVYNKSCLFRVINVKMQLRLVESVQAPGGRNLKISYINLKSRDLFYIDRRKIIKDEYNKHAVIVTITDDLDTVWNNPNTQHLELTVYAKNAFTNLERMVKEPYNDKSTVVKPGKFKTGSCTEIVVVP